MKKSQSVTFRLSQDVFNLLKETGRKLSVPVSDVIEKALSLYFRETDQKSVNYRIIYNDYPETSLENIKKNGILTREDLFIIADLIQRAYHKYSQSDVTTEWLIALISLYSELKSILKPESIKELSPYFLNTFPGFGDIDNRIKESLRDLESGIIPYGGYADMIARCLQVLIRDGEFDLSNELIRKIKNQIEPWCYWLARKAIAPNLPINIIKSEYLLKERTYKSPYVNCKKGNISIQAYLSQEEGKIRKRNFSCAIHFKNKSSITGNASSFVDLLVCLEELEKEQNKNISGIELKNESVSFGGITIYSSDDYPGIQTKYNKGAQLTHLTKNEFEDFKEAILKFYDNEDVKVDIAIQCVDEYGAI